MTLRIFISSVQKEFAQERAALRDYLRGDALMRRFFEPFVFEDVPAADRRADAVYLDEVERCDIYIGLFGSDYGVEDADGKSPTQREFEVATRLNKLRLVFVKGVDDSAKHPKMQALIRQAGSELIRRRFSDSEELLAAVYAALVQLLVDRELIRTGPFDATACADATLDDLDAERITRFVRAARHARNFPLGEAATPMEVLAHLDLLNKGRLTNAAVLLFGRQPQRFFVTAKVKCAHFHGTEMNKPIPSLQFYKGTVFELVDQATDFVLSKIDLWVGDRSASNQVPTAYEIPQQVVREAVVNAVCHRDYTSNASVQVMLFRDRLEVWNPGSLPPNLTLEQLRKPHPSLPPNPLLAEPMYLAQYIEQMGTGTLDIIERCRAAGLPGVEFRTEGGFWITTIWRKSAALQVAPHVTPEVTPEVAPEVTPEVRLLGALSKPLSRRELQDALALKDDEHFRKAYLLPALEQGLIEMTIPDRPNSRLQKYRRTAKGTALVEEHKK